jgi:hypothetical protein
LSSWAVTRRRAPGAALMGFIFICQVAAYPAV